MKQKTKTVIKLHERDSYRTKIMDISDDSQVLYELFLQGKEVLERLIIETKEFHKNAHSDIHSFSNNILVFCGDRGYGKTSAMVSFGDALKQYAPEATQKCPVFSPVKQ